jgi:hypothetical protein
MLTNYYYNIRNDYKRSIEKHVHETQRMELIPRRLKAEYMIFNSENPNKKDS